MTNSAAIKVSCRVCGSALLRKNRRKSYICAPCHGNRKRPGRKRLSRKSRTPEQQARQNAQRFARRQAGLERRNRATEYDKAREARRPAVEQRRSEIERQRAERATCKAKTTAKRAADRASKPWNAPGLSAAEKWATRYKLDAAFAIKERQRAAFRRTRNGHKIGDTLRAALKSGRETSLSDFLGYTADELRAHFERQFDGRMSWAAFHAGRIHIDHVVPISAFDVRDPEELRAAWALSNLRPLYKRKNLSKGARRTHLL